MAGIFKAYDIRGIYGETLDDDLARRIGRAFATFLACRKVVVGRDIRTHSESLFEALTDGLRMQGADVIDLGIVTTPMSYFANGSLGADAGIIITASHNPAEWNGFKLCRAEAVPISGASGIADIERIVRDGSFAPAASTPGTRTEADVREDYFRHVRSFAEIRRPLRVAVDYANAMGIFEGQAFEGLFEVDALFDTPDGSYPNHEANPLKIETLEALRATVRAGGHDFGIAFDGDADRAGFVDERGEVVPMDMITALIAESLLKRAPGAVIYYDLRSSWAVKEVIEENGGVPKRSRVGHAFIKQQMRESDAVFAGELSGHYYFKDNYFAESSALAAIYVANLVSQTGQTLSELVRPIQRYVASGEINSEVGDTERVLEALKETYAAGRAFELDGLSVEFDDWWFNVRTSNTEPLMRLNLEARTREIMEAKRDEVLSIIRGGSARGAPGSR